MSLISKFKSAGCRIIFTVSVVLGVSSCSETPVDPDKITGLYTQPLAKPSQDISVFHLGHSLVGRDMPEMLRQLSGPNHSYRSQLGWGTSLKAHWDPDEVINGFIKENAHDHYLDVKTAIQSGEFDAFVLTEMVEIKAAIEYYNSAFYLSNFIDDIHDKTPSSRIYLYETWHHLNDPDGWLNRLERDLESEWVENILYKAMAESNYLHPVYLIPVGQVLLNLFKPESRASIGTQLDGPEAIFASNDKGEQDTIHLNALGNYIVAVTHYAVLYQTSPIGLPRNLTLANGTAAHSPDEATALKIQEVVWETVQKECRTGITKCQ